jgi:hypothetical protein
MIDPSPEAIPGRDPADIKTIQENEPMKITIEYIASSAKGKGSVTPKTQVGELYSRMNKLVYPDEILGDIRSLKDQLFALDFINRKSNNTQNNKEK